MRPLRVRTAPRKISVTSETAEGYNTTLLSRELEPKLAALTRRTAARPKLPVTTQVTEMIQQMVKMIALALLFVYLSWWRSSRASQFPSIVVHHSAGLTGGMIGR